MRKRPSTYIGSMPSQGLHHMVYETMDNAADETLAGHCTLIRVCLNKSGSVTIRDNSRGIPARIQTKTELSAIQTVFAVLHAGGKFGDSNYKASGGLHGVGASVINALSPHLYVQVDQDSFSYAQPYERGVLTAPVKQPGSYNQGIHGIAVTFVLNQDIFPFIAWDRNILKERLWETTFLTQGLKISSYDLWRDPADEATCPVTVRSRTFCFRNGLKDFVSWLEQDGEPLYTGIISGRHETNEVQAEFALVYDSLYSEQLLGLANNVSIPEGGTHMTGFCQALSRVVNDYARNAKLLKDTDSSLSQDELSESLTAVLGVRLRNAQFEGQTKQKLGGSHVRPAAEQMVYTCLTLLLEQDPAVAEAICDKAMLARKVRTAVRTTREVARRKAALPGLSLPDKLANCSDKSPGECKLFVVEDDSTGGSTRLVRSREDQVALPLRGKIFDVEKASLDRISANMEIKAMISAFGTGIPDTFSLENLRCNKIIPMTDADVDGAHITMFLLTFLFRFIPKLVEEGHVFLAQPPLHRVEKGKKF